MKKKSASQSAFFHLRLLTGLFLALTGVFLALLGLGGFSAQAQQKDDTYTKSTDPLVPAGFDCSKIHQLGIDRQENHRAGAIMIFCHEAQGGSASPSVVSSKIIQKALAPLAYGATDVDLITGAETSPNITQSETYTAANPDNPLQVFAAYNDSRGRNASPINISGASISTDGGTTFTRITTAGGQSPFAGTEGDPVALYNRPTGTWFTVWLDTGCGGQGLGGYKSATPENAASWTHFCVHSGSSDDRESGWADNNPASPFYGRMYVSWNDFAVGVGATEVTFSTDNGLTWHAPVVLSNTATFIRDVQITGDMSGNGTIYVAGMNEGGGGFPHNNNNLIFRSTDGGVTWMNTYTGPAFPGPGVTSSGYFACMFSPAYWRHEGWGEPAAFNNVVSLVYAQQGGAGDAGDVYYIRSTDSGVTFGAPLKLNTDATIRPQWQPNISASGTGTLFATWYDARESATCTVGSTGVPCYRMWSRKSNDNGASWLPDDTFSDVVSPLPAQPDPGIVAVYVGDYDYGSATATKHVTSWADGRVAINSQSQQDAFTDRDLVGFAVTTANPTCGSIVSIQPTDFVINLTDPVNPATVQAGDFTVNGTPADSFMLGGGNTQITFHYNSTPVATQGVQTMHIPAGAFNKAADNAPNLDFTCTFCYAAMPLQVTTTVPAVGGAFSPPAPGDYQYDVNFNQAVDPASVTTSDLTITGNAGGSVTSVMLVNANMTARFMLHFSFGGNVTATIGAGAITANTCNSNVAFTGMYTVGGCPPQNHYDIAQIGGSIVPGTTDTGNHIDDGTTAVALPFPYTLYDQTFNSVNVDSNGTLQFVSPASVFTNTCLPFAGHTYVVLPYWDDLRTDVGLSGCSTFGNGCGIFTSVSGSAPNRIFNIEWHAVYFANNAQTANFEVRLYEGQSHFDVIYGSTSLGNTSSTAGVQKDAATLDQYFCNGSGGAATGGQSYILQSCTAPAVSSAVSRKTHGAAGDFDVNLPLTGTPGVECRSNSATNDYTMMVTFVAPVTVNGSPQANVSLGAGTVGSGGVSNGGMVTISGNTVTIPLTNVTNAQTINVTLHSVNGVSDVVIPMSVLIGDTNGNGGVNAGDVSQTKGQSGVAVGAGNFRNDVNASGATVNAGDVALVKSKSGTVLPP